MISYNKKYTIIHTPSFQKEQEKILKYIAFNLDSPKTKNFTIFSQIRYIPYSISQRDIQK